MNILFLTIGYPEASEQNLYSDLMTEINSRGNKVYVVCSRERRLGKPTNLRNEQGINILQVKTGNLTKTNIVEKGITTLLIERNFIGAIKQYLFDIKFDIVIYSTPPITFANVVQFVKKRDKCTSYLLLKDIFPQNAVDLGMMTKGSLLWRYFREREKRLYAISDYIGCMSKGNVNYVLAHNTDIPAAKVEVCPNSIRPNSRSSIGLCSGALREKYGVPSNAVLCVYGGNLGKPQGIDFLIDTLVVFRDRDDLFFLIVGSGTEYNRIATYLNKNLHKNVRLFSSIPGKDYRILLGECDIGLIFLSPRFTIPNFPSRLLSYMELAIPILAATDVNTDLKDILLESGAGLWVENGDLRGFAAAIERLSSDYLLRKDMGLAGREYLEKHYTASTSWDIILRRLLFNKKQQYPPC